MNILDLLIEILGPIPQGEITNGTMLYYVFSFILVIYLLKVFLTLIRSMFGIK